MVRCLWIIVVEMLQPLWENFCNIHASFEPISALSTERPDVSLVCPLLHPGQSSPLRPFFALSSVGTTASRQCSAMMRLLSWKTEQRRVGSWLSTLPSEKGKKKPRRRRQIPRMWGPQRDTNIDIHAHKKQFCALSHSMCMHREWGGKCGVPSCTLVERQAIAEGLSVHHLFICHDGASQFCQTEKKKKDNPRVRGSREGRQLGSLPKWEGFENAPG